MTQHARLIARRLNYCYNHCDSKDEERMVEWITEHLADELYGTNPRSKPRSEFIRASVPGSLIAAVHV